MLAIPSHNFDEQPLRDMMQNYIRTTHSEDVLRSTDRDIQAFVELRHQVLYMRENNYSEEIFGKYHCQMKNIVARLQSSSEGSGVTSKAMTIVKFVWYDAYKPSLKATSSLFIYDWINVLWNVGSLLSRLGAQANRGTDEGIKAANKYFQQSAGVFDSIQQIIATPRGQTLGAPGSTSSSLPCLSNDSLTFVKQLLLAQAQLCFYEKAVRDKKTSGTMKASVIAKLAAQTCTLFRAAVASCKVGAMASTLDASWSQHVEYQAILFSAASEYWQSQASKEIAMVEARGYGEEIARLSLAEQYLTQTLNIAAKHKLSPSFSDGASAFLKTVTSSKSAAEHDNRTVYMEAVPAPHSLPEITGLLMVKPLSIFDYNASLVAAGLPLELPLFQQILPKDVAEVKTMADDRLKELLRSTTLQANESSNEARVVLSSVGLPGSVESFKSGGDLPDSLWEKVQRIQSLGSMTSIRSKIQELHSSSQRVAISLSNIDDCLNKEESQDILFRSKHNSYDTTSNITPSKLLQKDLRENLGKLKSVFDIARDTSDKAVIQDILGPDASNAAGDTTRLLSMMAQGSMPIKQLNIYESILGATNKSQLIPLATKASQDGTTSEPKIVTDLLDMDHHEPPAYQSTVNLDSVIQSLEEKLVEVAQLIESREQLVNELTRDVPSTNHMIEARLIERHSAGCARPELQNIVDDTISGVIEQTKQRINDSVYRQDELLKSILKINESFTKAVANDKKTVERNQVIGKVEEIIAKFYNWHANITTGITFYINLQSRASGLLQNCDDIAYTQQLRRQEYEANLFKSYERTNQEALDHEMAMKLAAEMNMTPASASAPPPHTSVPQASVINNSNPASYGSSPYMQQPAQSISIPVWQQPPAYPPQPSSYPAPAAAYATYQPGMPPSQPQPQQHYYPQQPQAMHHQPIHHQQQQQGYDPSQYGIMSNQSPYNGYLQPPHQPNAQPLPQQPMQQTSQPAPTSASNSGDHESKVQRLTEMGFAKHVAEHYLKASKDNEEVALNDILSASEATLNSIPDPNAPKSSSLFGKVWGKK